MQNPITVTVIFTALALFSTKRSQRLVRSRMGSLDQKFCEIIDKKWIRLISDNDHRNPCRIKVRQP